MTRLHRKYGRRCDWQGSWMKPYLEREYRKEKRETDMYYKLFGNPLHKTVGDLSDVKC